MSVFIVLLNDIRVLINNTLKSGLFYNKLFIFSHIL